MGGNLIDLVTYPVAILGLLRGSYRTYKALENPDFEKQQKVLEFWVVLIAILFLFPWIEWVLSWIMLGSIMTTLKVILLLAVAINEKQLGFVYKLMEEQVMPAVEPYVQRLLKETKGLRSKACDTILFAATEMHQWLMRLLVSQCDSQHLDELKSQTKKTTNCIKMELVERAKNERKDETSSVWSQQNKVDHDPQN